jgi:hypothetical protein
MILLSNQNRLPSRIDQMVGGIISDKHSSLMHWAILFNLSQIENTASTDSRIESA